MGSAAPGSSMPEEHRQKLVIAFRQLSDYQVLWKWETEEMEDLPPNVKLSKWLPQQDILGHSGCRLFISHGGLLSTQEAIYHSVPVLGMPIAADQMLNIKNTERSGAGLSLPWDELTPGLAVEKIRQLIETKT